VSHVIPSYHGELSRLMSDAKFQRVDASLSHTTLKRNAFEQTKDAYPELLIFRKLSSTRLRSVTMSITGCLPLRLLVSSPSHLLQSFSQSLSNMLR